jgi:hypothetical protein
MEQNQELPLQWKEDEKFELSGREFEALLNIVRASLTTKEAQNILLLARANDVLENILQKGIKEGKVVQQKIPADMHGTQEKAPD